MARPWSRKRVDDPRRPKHLRAEDDPVDSVSLDAADHAWWSQTDVARAWEPPSAGTGTETATVRDVLALRVTARWRDVVRPGAEPWEVLSCLLALLELARRSELTLAQPKPFADVEIRRELAGEAA